jgi:hypothetical protein
MRVEMWAGSKTMAAELSDLTWELLGRMFLVDRKWAQQLHASLASSGTKD